MIDIYRVPWGGLPQSDFKFPCLVLEADSWDDFKHVTLFHAKWYTSRTEAKALGDTKILERGKEETELQQHFNNLGTEFCSLGQAIS